MHERAYGYAAPDDPVELVNVRLAAVGVTPKPRRAPLPEGGPSAAPAREGPPRRLVRRGGRLPPTMVLDRGKLLRGNVIDGPAIIEEPDASTLVHPGWTATVDEHANLVLRPLRPLRRRERIRKGSITTSIWRRTDSAGGSPERFESCPQVAPRGCCSFRSPCRGCRALP